MDVIKRAIAGTKESSDVFTVVEPHDNGLIIEIESPVKMQFGDSIQRTAAEVARELNVTNGLIMIDDHGALDCTIRARIETALIRASKKEV